MAFTVSDKLVRERFGDGYDLSKWVEGVDWVRRKCFKGEKVVFRKGFLEGETGHSNTVTQLHSDIVDPRGEGEVSMPCAEAEIERKVEVGGSGVYECKVVKLYPNQRYACTDRGMIYVGGKTVKRGQVVRVQDGVLVVRRGA